MQVNDKLDDLCKSFSFHFISNFEITRDFFCDGGVSLKKERTSS